MTKKSTQLFRHWESGLANNLLAQYQSIFFPQSVQFFVDELARVHLCGFALVSVGFARALFCKRPRANVNTLGE